MSTKEKIIEALRENYPHLVAEYGFKKIGLFGSYARGVPIQEAMNAAGVAILLISANSLTSDFILREEISRLLERRASEGLRIFPVIIKPCDWEAVGWLRRMNLRLKGIFIRFSRFLLASAGMLI